MSKRTSSVPLRSNDQMVATIATHLEKTVFNVWGVSRHVKTNKEYILFQSDSNP